MDPNANLEEQLKIANAIVNDSSPISATDLAIKAALLSEYVIALDEWLRNSGHLPKPWADKRGHCNDCEEDHP